MCALHFFNTAETDLVGDDSNYPLRQWNSALSPVLRDCLSFQDCSESVRRPIYFGDQGVRSVLSVYGTFKSEIKKNEKQIILMFYEPDRTMRVSAQLCKNKQMLTCILLTQVNEEYSFNQAVVFYVG